MPGFSDRWPDPDDMPQELKEILKEIEKYGQEKLAEIEENSFHRSKSWWRVEKTAYGTLNEVWVNKPTGSAAGLWTFSFSINNAGVKTIEVFRYRYLDSDPVTIPCVRAWELPASLSDADLTSELAALIGWRSAEAAVRRLRPAE